MSPVSTLVRWAAVPPESVQGTTETRTVVYLRQLSIGHCLLGLFVLYCDLGMVYKPGTDQCLLCVEGML